MTDSTSEALAGDNRPFGDAEAPITRDQRPTADAPSMLELAGTITSQAALIGGLLYYFGWMRTGATLAYFGLNTRLVGYSYFDYQLGSISIALALFLKLASAALLFLGVHRWVIQRVLEMPAGSRAQRIGRQFVAATQMVGIAVATLVIIGVWVTDQIGQPLGRTLPWLLIGSVTLLCYAAHLRSAYPKMSATTQPSHSRSLTLVLLTLGVIGVVWVVGLHAEQVGKRDAIAIVASLPDRPVVVLYSTERIAVAGAGVQVAEIIQPGSKYRYQYSGIRLFDRSTDKYLLLPVGWQRGRDRVFIIQDDDSVRVDIAAR
jgi:hypothetical protein